MGMRKFIRYLAITVITCLLTIAGIIGFYVIRNHADTTTKTVKTFILPHTEWTIIEKVTWSNSAGTLGTASSMEIVAHSGKTGEQVVLMTGPEIYVVLSSDEQGHLVITPAKGFPVDIRQRILGSTPVVYN